MIGYRAAGTGFVVATLVAAAPCAAQPRTPSRPEHRERITVVLKDSTTHEANKYQRHGTVAALLLVDGSTHRFISFSDIEAVLDSTGANIAPRLLRMQYRPTGLAKANRQDFLQARSISLHSGKVIKHVRTLVNPDRRELLVLDGASPQAIPWNEIERVVDEEGQVRTPSGSDVAVPDSLSRASPASTRGHTANLAPDAERARLPWRFAIDLRSGFDTGIGDYYTGTAGGTGFGGTLHAALSDEAAIVFDVQMLGLEFDHSFGLISFDPNVVIVSQRFDLDALRLGVGAEYHALLDRWNPRKGLWFLQTSVGVIRHALTGEATIQVGNETASAKANDTEAAFVLTVGAGVIRVVRSGIGLSLSGDVGWLQKDSIGIVAGVRAGVAFVE